MVALPATESSPGLNANAVPASTDVLVTFDAYTANRCCGPVIGATYYRERKILDTSHSAA
jgi:hypothetical protein